MDGVGWSEEVAQTVAGFMGLGPSVLSQLDSVVGDRLVNLAVLWEQTKPSVPLFGIIAVEGGSGTHCCPLTEHDARG